MKKYIMMSKPEYTLIIKLLLCTVLATIFSWAIGDIHNPTTAVTANLFLYVDRGYRGSILYATRRILSQIIQGFLVLLLIFPCKYFHFPVYDGVLILVACCFAIVIGFPLNFKHTYAPLNCTLANATFIIACAAVQDIGSFPKRVLQCVVGALIGYFVNYIVFPYQDRGKTILHLADDSITALIQNRDFAAFNQTMALVEKEYAFVIADKGKKRRNSKMTQDEIGFLEWTKESLYKLSSFISAYEDYKDEITVDCKHIMWELLPTALTVHRQLLTSGLTDSQPIETLTVPYFNVDHHEDMVLLSRLIEYINVINQFEARFQKVYSPVEHEMIHRN